MWERRDQIDKLLEGAAQHWELHRLAAVDRSILRMAHTTQRQQGGGQRTEDRARKRGRHECLRSCHDRALAGPTSAPNPVMNHPALLPFSREFFHMGPRLSN